MKVVILCGGRGTRLASETVSVPKPLVEVGGKPILWHVMKIFAAFGHTEFILYLGYKGHLIKEYFLNYDLHQSDFTITLGQDAPVAPHRPHPEHGWQVHCVDTGQDTLTGGRIKRIERFVGNEEFLLTYGDGVADIDLAALADFHRSHGKIATVTGVRPLSRFGELMVEGRKVVEFSEKPQVHQGLINGGFFVLRPDVFRYVQDSDACTFEREPLERLARDGQLMLYPHTGSWQCVDTPRDLQVMNEQWASGAFWKVWDRTTGQSK